MPAASNGILVHVCKCHRRSCIPVTMHILAGLRTTNFTGSYTPRTCLHALETAWASLPFVTCVPGDLGYTPSTLHTGFKKSRYPSLCFTVSMRGGYANVRAVFRFTRTRCVSQFQGPLHASLLRQLQQLSLQHSRPACTRNPHRSTVGRSSPLPPPPRSRGSACRCCNLAGRADESQPQRNRPRSFLLFL